MLIKVVSEKEIIMTTSCVINRIHAIISEPGPAKLHRNAKRVSSFILCGIVTSAQAIATALMQNCIDAYKAYIIIIKIFIIIITIINKMSLSWQCRTAAAGPPYNVTMSCYATVNNCKNR